MKSKNRKIVIDNQVYVWNFTPRYDLINDMYFSRLFFSPQDNKDLSVVCLFHSRINYTGGCPFNEGILATKDGEEYRINLNQPKFVSKLIRFILANMVDFEKQKNITLRMPMIF